MPRRYTEPEVPYIEPKVQYSPVAVRSLVVS